MRRKREKQRKYEGQGKVFFLGGGCFFALPRDFGCYVELELELELEVVLLLQAHMAQKSPYCGGKRALLPGCFIKS
jgi:hypothetical protein